jgi:hypothetical protein
MSVLRYRRSSDGQFELLTLPAGPDGPPGDKGTTGATGPQGDKGATGATGPQGDKGNTGATGGIGDRGATGATGARGPDGDPTSGSYGSLRWRVAWGTVQVSAAANAHTAWSVGFGFTYAGGYNAIVTGVKGNWGNTVAGAGLTAVNANGLQGVVRNNGSADSCWVAWIAWGYW